MKKQGQQGFTLIELIVVIVILGILAAVAVPKFVDFSSDARSANLKATAAAVQAAANMGYGMAAIQGKTGAAADVTVRGISGQVSFVHGWPAATLTGIGAMLVEVDENWDFTSSPPRYELKTNCHVEYNAATDADNPADIDIEASGC